MTGIHCAVLGVLNLLWTLSQADSVSVSVSCVVMETCILPCSFHSGSDIIIHWMHTAEDKNVHSYYHNQNQLDHQNQGIRGRTSLFQDQISRGNASLQLMGVQVQDQGQYKCYASTISGNKETLINLRVDGPVHKVHIERVGNTLSCSSEGIYPEPGLTWSTSPPSNRTLNTTTTVQQNEQLLYNISSSLVLDDGGTDVDYSCTVSTRINREGATLYKPVPDNPRRVRWAVLAMVGLAALTVLSVTVAIRKGHVQSACSGFDVKAGILSHWTQHRRTQRCDLTSSGKNLNPAALIK